MNSIVEFTDLLTGRAAHLELVLPEEADPQRDRVSVDSPVGASLLGLIQGGSIGVSGDDGRSQVLVVNDVRAADGGQVRRRSGSLPDRAPANAAAGRPM